MNLAEEKGYLKEQYKFFYLKDKMTGEMDYHYHSFNKIVIFMSGEASYVIEGRSYKLKPWDVVFVKHHTVHKPEVDLSQSYERVVIWISEEFLEKFADRFDLSECFEKAETEKSNILRINAQTRLSVSKICETLRHEQRVNLSGKELVCDCNIINLLVLLNRSFNDDEHIGYKTDPKIEAVMQYINENLSEELSVESLAEKCFMSRYHFMRRFKEISGYTVHNYVTLKRLSAAARMIGNGSSPTEAAHLCGFSDYSVFLRAFKKMFELSPNKFAKK